MELKKQISYRNQLKSLRNNILYWIDHSGGIGTKHNMPFTIGCDIKCKYGYCKFISYFDVNDDTNQDSVYVLTEDEKVKTINSWSLNYNKNHGLDVSISDVLRLIGDGYSVRGGGYLMDKNNNYIVGIDLTKKLSEQEGVCREIVKIIKSQRN